jgi:Ras-related protein Rab-5C
VTLQLWDTSGQDAFRDLVSLYYRDSNAAILVFDYTNPDSLKNLSFWLKELEDRVEAKSIVLKIAGNKHDLYDPSDSKLSPEEVRRRVSEFGNEPINIVNTSAQTGENVYELFESIAQECFNRFA